MIQFLTRALLALLLILPTMPAAQAAGWLSSDRVTRVDTTELARTFFVGTRALNVRSDPSVNNSPIAVVEQGEALRQLEVSYNTDERRAWMRVQRTDGSTGWVASNFLEPIAPALERVEEALALSAALGTATLPATRPGIAEVRAGFLYVGPVGDAGWTYSHDQGRKALEALPFVKSTTYLESVPEDPALVEAAIDKLIANGANLIFTTSFGYMDPTIAAAARHPEIVFMHCSGYKTAANVGTYFGREYEARYLVGLLAGAMSESGIIGYVAAFPIPEVLRGIDAFTLGALSVNPDIEVRVIWTDTWFGPGIEREAATKLLDYGADILTMHQDSPAVVQAAEQRGKRAIGYHSDMRVFGPGAVLASAVWDWSPIYTKIATDVHQGTWQPYKLWWGLKEGTVKVASIDPKLPDSLRERVQKATTQLANGQLRIFAGTIRDNAGVVRVRSGQILSDADLLGIDWLVLGVKGDLPPPSPATVAN